LLTARRLHEYELPEGWLACAAINPEKGDYQVTPLDPALRSRFMNLTVRADRTAWLLWARDNGVHPAILEIARAHDHFLEATPPRTWTYVSHLLRAARPDEVRQANTLRAALGGYLAPAWIEVVLAALSKAEACDGFDVRAMLRNYHQDSAAQKAPATVREQGRRDVLEAVGYRALEIVDSPELHRAVADREFTLEAFERLIADLPGDHREQLQECLGDNPAAAALLNVKPTD